MTTLLTTDLLVYYNGGLEVIRIYRVAVSQELDCMENSYKPPWRSG